MLTTGASGTAIGTGSANTACYILAQGTETSSAARLARGNIQMVHIPIGILPSNR